MSERPADMPLYRRLAETLQEKIQTGILPAGSKLPTVRQLAEEQNLAPGTVKRAYDELSAAGVIEVTQGRGTFVRGLRPEPRNRKELAMNAIDTMFDALEALSLTPREISIFLELKLQERLQGEAMIRICLIGTCPEVLQQLSEQLRSIEGAVLQTSLLKEALRFPGALAEKADILAVTADCYLELAAALHNSPKLLPLALQPTGKTRKELLALPAHAKVGTAAQSRTFTAVMEDTVKEWRPELQLLETDEIRPGWTLGKDGLDALLLPGNYRQSCSELQLRQLRNFGRDHEVIAFAMEADTGSLLHLQGRIQETKSQKGF